MPRPLSRITRESLALAILLGASRLLIVASARPLSEKIDNQTIKEFVAHVRDPESVLSVGRKLSLEHLDMWSLELVPNVSDTLARNVLKRHQEIIEMAASLRPGQKHRAFEVAKGVGLKTAKSLGESIDMSPE